MQLEQPGQEQAAEQLAQYPHRQEESGTRGCPVRPARRDATARDDHVHVRMMGQGRTPGVKHGGDPDPCTQVLRVGGDGQHRLRRRAKQQVVEHRLVVEGNGGDLCGQGEHDVEVADRQQVGLAFGQPDARRRALALGTVPVAAGVVGHSPVPAVGAGLDMATQRRGAAMLDRRHDLELGQAQMPGMGGPIGRACAAEDIGDLEVGAHRLSRAAMPFVPGPPSAR